MVHNALDYVVGGEQRREKHKCVNDSMTTIAKFWFHSTHMSKTCTIPLLGK